MPDNAAGQPPESRDRIIQLISPHETPNPDALASSISSYVVGDRAVTDRIFYKYQGSDPEQSRNVFIKILRSGCVGGGNFRRDYEALLSSLIALDHPYLVPVFDGGVVKDCYYVVEERLEGFVLNRGIESDHFSHDDKVKVIGEIIDAIAYLHENGIVHGDLNPGNVFITVNEVAKVSGYGIPRLLELYGTDPPILDTSRRRFAAPEVRGGNPATMLSDVYSLGVIAAALFRGEDFWQEAAHAGGRSLNGDRLSAVLRRATAADPGERYSTAAEFQRALERGLSDEKAGAAGKSVSRRFAVPALAVIIALLLGIIALLATGGESGEPSATGGPAGTGTEQASVSPPSGSAADVLPENALRESPAVPAPVTTPAFEPEPAGEAASEAEQPTEFIVRDNEWPGYRVINSMPEQGLPWSGRSAWIVFDDGSDETRRWIEELEESPEAGASISRLYWLRCRAGGPETLRAFYGIKEFPAVVVTEENGRAVARFGPNTTSDEIAFSLRLLERAQEQDS